MSPKRRRYLLVFVVLTMLMLLALAIFPPGEKQTNSPVPNPNGYDDFLAAGKAISGDPSVYSSMGQETLHQLLASNAEPLRLVRLGLTRGCSLPTDRTTTNTSSWTTDLPALRKVALLLVAEGRLAEMENRPIDAAHRYVDAITFGDRISHGGMIVYRLVGILCEGIGTMPLAKLASSLNCEQARLIIADLERIDRDSVSWDEVMKAERRFARAQVRQYSNPISLLVAWWEGRGARNRTREKHYGAIARLRLLTAELALQCYQAEHGNAPSRLDDLVPKYLGRAPVDPFSGKELVFRPKGSNWLLYSVGPDGVDDGGRSIIKGTASANSAPRGDILLDSPW